MEKMFNTVEQRFTEIYNLEVEFYLQSPMWFS